MVILKENSSSQEAHIVNTSNRGIIPSQRMNPWEDRHMN